MDDVEREIRVVAERAKIVFDEMGWTWYGEEHPPTIEALKDGIRELYDTCEKNIRDEDKWMVSSGKIICEIWKNDENNLYRHRFSMVLLSTLPNEDVSDEEAENKMRGLR